MSTSDVRAYLDGLTTEFALWWFIENSTEESPWRTEIFFYLRERVKSP